MPAYSFLDVNAAIVGPGGAFNLGSGAGAAEEGITVEAAQDMNSKAVGADGAVANSLIADKSGQVTIRLLKTSPVNAQLAAMQALQRVSAATHGQNQLTIVNRVSGDTISCSQVAFKRVPTLNYAKEAGMNEWVFDAGVIDPGLGAGV